MKKKNPKIAYDKKNQILSIEMKSGKSVDSDIQENAVIDYDKKGEVVRVSFYKFSFDDFKKDEKALKGFSRVSRTPAVVK